MEEKKTNEERTEKKIIVDDIEITVGDSVLHGNKPYYRIKYREVGKNYYNLGFGSYYLENVIKWRKEEFEVVSSERSEEEAGNKTNTKVEEVENKLDIILESQATIMNAIGSVICMSEIKDEDLKMKNATLENLINHRDTCMKEVHGKSYEEMMEAMDTLTNMVDVLDKIFK